MNNRSGWKVRALLGLSVGWGCVAVASAQTTDGAGEEVMLERFEVTGSRVTRIAAEGPNPVTVFRRADIEVGGYTNIGDALRTLPYVSGSNLMPAGSNNSFTPGASTVNLRGLGNNNVLVLLNGRRAAPLSTPGFNGLQTMFDFNSIPEAAIESIEILKDAGSAIYGSDAVSGVINIKTRKHYNGLSTEIGFGNTTHTDSLERRFAAVMGTSSGKTSLLFSVDWRDRNGIKDRDYSFSSTADHTSRGGDDLRSYATFPALVYVPGLGDYYTLPSPMTNPTLADFQVADVSHGTYDFQKVTDLLPETRAYGFYGRGQFDFNANVSAFIELMYRRNEAIIEAAPSPVFSYTENGTGPNTATLTIPATNPNNPFGEDLEDEWYARLVNAGNRINDVTSETPRILVGLEGRFGDSWQWEAAALHTTNDVVNLNDGTVFDNLYQNALNGVEIDGETLYANPFGSEDPRVTDYYTGVNPNTSTFELRTYDFNISGDLLEMPYGALGFATGGEIRTEELENIRTVDNENGNVIGGAEGTSTYGDRRVYAFYAELGVPILPRLDAQIAGRFENYSDFGSTTKPKIALSYRPTDELLIRGSFGQSFLAPNLSYLYTSQVTSFSSSPLADPKRPNDAPRQIQTYGGGNPDLQPENTDTYYVGVQWEPRKGKMKGWSFGVDWLQFKQRDLINQLGEDFILSHEDELPGAVVRNPPAAGETVGVINYINDRYRNIDRQTYRAFDFETRYEFDTASLGDFRFIANATYMYDFIFQSEELAGTYDQPKWRGTFQMNWTRGDWEFDVLVAYIGRFLNYSEVGNVGAQTIVNPQISYLGLWDSRITLGVRNVLDSDPPFDEFSSTGWNGDIHDPEQAFVYLRIAKEW